MNRRNPPAICDLSRRRFVQGIAAGSALASLGGLPAVAFAAELTGQTFDLTISALPVNFTGRPAVATTVNGQIPGPTLRWREGETVTLRVTNRLDVPTSIHWHGIILPAEMDGVPGLSFDGIMPGETFVYRFRAGQSGTYWYHAHSGFQEQTGVYGAIIIEPRQPQLQIANDHVVLLSDWTDEDPQRVYEKLKTFNGYYNYAKPTLGDFLRQAQQEGVTRAWRERMMWSAMRMNPRDLADVSGATYTFLVNGMTPQDNWTALCDNGKARLRFINASAMTYFDVRIPGLKMTVIAADGQEVHPVTVDEFRIATAETFDVLVEPESDRAYTIFAQSMDRSGYARATLAPRPGMSADIPALDPVPTLTMADMGMGAMDGMDMPEHDMSSMGDMQDMDMSSSMTEITRHPASENNPGSATQARALSTRLDDPGAGLRDNGRRVLTYADLRAIDDWQDPREPERAIELHLTGNMQRYMWSFDGVPYAEAAPIRLTYGERLRIVLVNDTMMDHPIHLHGMWSEIENADGEFQARKHTVRVQPGHTINYRVLANARGRWAYHCHLMYHMNGGMFREMSVA
ncbi:MAG: copper resistance system multicopper oxidase [Gallionellaceae bacterium]|nr:copper resistance system multicopper oxidase [Gallionellaceae bacterium]